MPPQWIVTETATGNAEMFRGVGGPLPVDDMAERGLDSRLAGGAWRKTQQRA